MFRVPVSVGNSLVGESSGFLQSYVIKAPHPIFSFDSHSQGLGGPPLNPRTPISGHPGPHPLSSPIPPLLPPLLDALLSPTSMSTQPLCPLPAVAADGKGVSPFAWSQWDSSLPPDGLISTWKCICVWFMSIGRP